MRVLVDRMTVDSPSPLWSLLYMRDAFALDVVRDVPRCSPPVVSVVTTGLTPPVTGAEVERTWASAIVNPYAVEVLDAVERLLFATPADVQEALRVWKNSRTEEIVADGDDHLGTRVLPYPQRLLHVRWCGEQKSLHRVQDLDGVGVHDGTCPGSLDLCSSNGRRQPGRHNRRDRRRASRDIANHIERESIAHVQQIPQGARVIYRHSVHKYTLTPQGQRATRASSQ